MSEALESSAELALQLDTCETTFRREGAVRELANGKEQRAEFMGRVQDDLAGHEM